ncbi:MAG: YgjP-like metallopeptidase domain-containing protein [Opitutales bacterium]
MSEPERGKLVELVGRSNRFWAPCRLRRSAKAKRVSVRMLAGGEVELVIPLRHSEQEAFAFLQGQGEWIERRLACSVAPVALLEYLRKKPHLTIDGQIRPIIFSFGNSKGRPSWRRSDDTGVEFTLDPAQDPERQMIPLANDLAKSYLPVRVARWGKRFGLSPKSVRVGNQRSRWGSCSSQGVLSLNWRLLLLEPNLHDYVICHELAHLKIMNHSTNYWSYLSKMNPKATELDRELNKISRQLMSVGRTTTR